MRQHQDNKVILKLKENIPLTEDDMKELESILWSEVGSKKDYEAEYGSKPLGTFVRAIVGLDMGLRTDKTILFPPPLDRIACSIYNNAGAKNAGAGSEK